MNNGTKAVYVYYFDYTSRFYPVKLSIYCLLFKSKLLKAGNLLYQRNSTDAWILVFKLVIVCPARTGAWTVYLRPLRLFVLYNIDNRSGLSARGT
jgi:hypothetical protein